MFRRGRSAQIGMEWVYVLCDLACDYIHIIDYYLQLHTPPIYIHALLFFGTELVLACRIQTLRVASTKSIDR